MFNGIIKTIGKINSLIKPSDNSLNISVHCTELKNFAPEIGSSIAINGICLTIVKMENDNYFFDISPNTLSKTTANNWKIDDIVNVEASLKYGEEISGHLVQGHVDYFAKVIAIDEKDESHFIKIEIPNEYSKYLIKGDSIAIDGISMTINDVSNENIVHLCVIPHTWENTIFKFYKVNHLVNFEINFYVKRNFKTNFIQEHLYSKFKQELEKINSWYFDIDGKLSKTFEFKNFMESLNFINKISNIAEEINHHPEVHINYNLCTIKLFTFDKNNITESDFKLAKEIDKL